MVNVLKFAVTVFVLVMMAKSSCGQQANSQPAPALAPDAADAPQPVKN